MPDDPNLIQPEERTRWRDVTTVPIRRLPVGVIRMSISGYKVTLGFDIDSSKGGGIAGPEGLEACGVEILIPFDIGKGMTPEQLIAEGWRRFDLLKPML